MEASSIVVLLVIVIIVCVRLLSGTKPKPATGAPRRITNDDFEIVRREASRD
jgi:hypothetical protein